MTNEQRKLLNAACADLAEQIEWHGKRLDHDSWRHLLAGTILGWVIVPGIDRGEGEKGFVMLGGSSLKLTTQQATEAITMAFWIGDDPSSQGLDVRAVRWGPAVCKARWLVKE